MRRRLAIATTAALIFVAAPASARVLEVVDTDQSTVDPTMNIERAVIKNGARAISFTAVVEFLPPDVTTGSARLFLTTKGSSSPLYLADWTIDRDYGKTNLFKLAGGYQPVRCGGLRFRWLGAPDDGSDRPGKIKFTIPQKCLRKTERVRFSFELINRRLDLYEPLIDHVPGEAGDDSRWVRRG